MDFLITKEEDMGRFLNTSENSVVDKTQIMEGEILDPKKGVVKEINEFLDFLRGDRERSRVSDYIATDTQGFPIFWDPKIKDYVRVDLRDRIEGPIKLLTYGFIFRKEEFITDLKEFFTKLNLEINEAMIKEVIRANREKNKIKVVFDIKFFYSPSQRGDRAQGLESSDENTSIKNYQEEMIKIRSSMAQELKEYPENLVLEKIFLYYDRMLRQINTIIYNKRVSPNVLKEEKNSLDFYIYSLNRSLHTVLHDTFSNAITYNLWSIQKQVNKPYSLAHWARSQTESKDSKQKDSRMNFNSNFYFLVDAHRNIAENYLEIFRENKLKEKGEKKKKVKKIQTK